MEGDSSYAAFLLQKLGEQCNDPIYSDVVLKAQDDCTPIYASRNVLATNSYFKAMLWGPLAEGEQRVVVLCDIRREILLACVRFIYTGRGHGVEEDTVFPILYAADMLDLPQLVQLCCRRINELVQPRCCISYLAQLQPFFAHAEVRQLKAVCLTCFTSSWSQFDGADWEGIESLDLVTLQDVCHCVGRAATSVTNAVPCLDLTLAALVRWGAARGVAPTAAAFCEFVHEQRVSYQVQRWSQRQEFTWLPDREGASSWGASFSVIEGLDARYFFDGEVAFLEITVSGYPKWWVEYIAVTNPLGELPSVVWAVGHNRQIVAARERVRVPTRAFHYDPRLSHNPLRSICHAHATRHESPKSPSPRPKAVFGG